MERKPRLNKKALFNKTVRFLKSAYLKLFRINDTPQRIAFGFGVGVFLGVMPGAGPVAALLFAILLKINRASALIGSILTNTWLSIPVFLLSVKTGSAVTGISYKDISEGWALLLKDFNWVKLFQVSVYKIIFPIAVGYLIVSAFIGILAYTVILAVISMRKKGRMV